MYFNDVLVIVSCLSEWLGHIRLSDFQPVPAIGARQSFFKCYWKIVENGRESRKATIFRCISDDELRNIFLQVNMII